MISSFTPPPIRCSLTARIAFQPIAAVPPTQTYDVEQRDIVELTQRVAQLALEQADGVPQDESEPLSLPRLEEFRPCLNIGVEEPELISIDSLPSSDDLENIPDETDQPHTDLSPPEDDSTHPFFPPPMIWLPLPRPHDLYPWLMPPAMAVPPGFNPFFHWRWKSFPQPAWYSPVFIPPPLKSESPLEGLQQEEAAPQEGVREIQ